MFVLGVAPVPAVTAQVIAIDRAVPSPARQRQKGVAVMLGASRCRPPRQPECR